MSTLHWDVWQFLLGEWVGEGDGTPGQGSGGFTFAFDLDGKILVRKNYAEYPATNAKPAYRHDDLMIIYEAPEGIFRANYFDSEGHVINYAIEFSADQKTTTFISDRLTAAPRFRFTYEKIDVEHLGIQFEIAPPGKPDDFSIYIQASAYRK